MSAGKVFLVESIHPESNATRKQTQRALNSAVECHLHTVEVIGSNPVAPTTSGSKLLDQFRNSGWVEIYKFLLAPAPVRGNITKSSVAARSGAAFRAKTKALI